MKNMRKKLFRYDALWSFFLATACVIANAETPVDCEDIAKANAYATDFDKRLKTGLADSKAKENSQQKKYEESKARIVRAGAWSEQEATDFLLNVAMNTPEGKELEAKRAKASKEFKTLMYALDGLPIIAAGNKQAERRGVCILGQKAFLQLDAINESSSAAWELVYSHVQAYGKEKGISGF